MRTDVVFVHPDASALYQGLRDELAAVEPPLWALMLAQYARRQGLTVAVVDAEVDHLDSSMIGARVAAHEPLLVAVVVYGHHPSASTQVMPAARAAAAGIRNKAPTTKIVFVGGHAAALPERTCSEEPTDFVVTGEGFQTVVGLVEKLKAGVSASNVPGLVYRHQFSGRPTRSPGTPKNLADLTREVPRPAHDLVDLSRYRAHNWHALGHPERTPYASIYTSLGCPFDCSFCCIQAPFRQGDRAATGLDVLGDSLKSAPPSYRRWSPARVAHTLAQLRAQGVKHVKIADEMFVLNRSHVVDVCEAIQHEGLTDLNLWAYARVDTVPAGLEKKLAESGFKWLAFGIESGSQAIRDKAKKGFTIDQTRETLDRVRAAGIRVIANYIFGLPGEDAQSMLETLELAEELNAEYANFYCAAAYPGSALYATVDPAELPQSWEGYHQHSRSFRPLRASNLTADEVVSFRDYAWKRYHTRDAYLAGIEAAFGTPAREAVLRAARVPVERENP